MTLWPATRIAEQHTFFSTISAISCFGALEAKRKVTFQVLSVSTTGRSHVLP